MERHPLDAELVEENYEQLRRAKVRLEARIALEHDIPRLGFARVLISQLRSGKIDEDEDIMRWQRLQSAWLDWVNASTVETEPIESALCSAAEGPPEAALFCFSHVLNRQYTS